MPLLIFWLTPVVLVVVFLLVVFAYRPSRRVKLFLVEPLLFLVDTWRLARCDGDEAALRRLIAGWLPGLELQQSVVEQLIRQIQASPPVLPDKEAVVLSQQGLRFWAEERKVEQAGKETSIIAGAISEVIDYCDSDFAGRLTPEKRIAWPGKAEQAAKHGFLALALAESAAPDALLRKKYRLAGLAILEPSLNNRAVTELRQVQALGHTRYLSLLNADLVEQLVQRVFPIEKLTKATGPELSNMSPKEQERAVEGNDIYGEIAPKSRYWIARHLQRRYELNVISRLSSDEELPADGRF